MTKVAEISCKACRNRIQSTAATFSKQPATEHLARNPPRIRTTVKYRQFGDLIGNLLRLCEEIQGIAIARPGVLQLQRSRKDENDSHNRKKSPNKRLRWQIIAVVRIVVKQNPYPDSLLKENDLYLQLTKNRFSQPKTWNDKPTLIDPLFQVVR